MKKKMVYKNYVEVSCPLGCGKKISGTSKKHWIQNFEKHLSGKKHRIIIADKQKRILEKVKKDLIKIPTRRKVLNA